MEKPPTNTYKTITCKYIYIYIQMYIKCLLEKHTKWSKRNKTNQAEDDMYVLS